MSENQEASLKELAERTGVTAKEIANELGLGKSTVYLILDGNYNGSDEKIQKVTDLINSRLPKKGEFQTLDQQGMGAVLKFTLLDNEFSVIVGASGIGKTTTAKKFQNNHDGIMVYKVVEGASYGGILADLLHFYGQTPYGSNDDKRARLFDSVKRSKCRMLIVDEADLLVGDGKKKKSFLKKVSIFRELHEASDVPIVMVGLEVFENELRNSRQTYVNSRIGYFFKFKQPVKDDYEEFWEKVLGLELSKGTKTLFSKASDRGCFRLLDKVGRRSKDLDSVETAIRIVFM